MGLITTFVTGAVVGSVLTWQANERNVRLSDSRIGQWLGLGVEANNDVEIAEEAVVAVAPEVMEDEPDNVATTENSDATEDEQVLDQT